MFNKNELEQIFCFNERIRMPDSINIKEKLNKIAFYLLQTMLNI